MVAELIGAKMDRPDDKNVQNSASRMLQRLVEWPVRFDQISSRVLIVQNSDFGPVGPFLKPL